MEAPVPYLSKICPLIDFHWVLANVCLKDGEYLDFYHRNNKPGSLLVLDNGVNEEGIPCSVEQIDDIARILNPKYIVPPDFLGDSERTVESLKEGIDFWGRDRILPVLQASSDDEVIWCRNQIVDLGFDRICIPYDILRTGDTSPEILADLRSKIINDYLGGHFKWIHLLGLNTLEELQNYCLTPNVSSIDTGAPFLNAYKGKKFGEDRLVRKGVKIDYDILGWDPKIFNTCVWNIAYLRRFMT